MSETIEWSRPQGFGGKLLRLGRPGVRRGPDGLQRMIDRDRR